MPSAGSSEPGRIDARATLAPRQLALRARLSAIKRPPDIQDILDWADVFDEQGEAAGAQAMRAVAWLRQGFSPQVRAERAGIAQGAPTAARTAPRWTVDIAKAEALILGRVAGLPTARALSGHERREETKAQPHLTSLSRQLFASDAPRAMHEMLDGLVVALGRIDADDDDIAGWLNSMRGALHAADGLQPGDFALASTPLLASGLALLGARAFLQEARDLFALPLGSPALLHVSARFDQGGLGPYLRNVGQIARRSADVFELAGLAQRGAAREGAETELEVWAALLSRGLKGGLLLELIDDLGDRNAGVSLSLILDRAACEPKTAIDQNLVFRVRDAALDNLNYDLAARAQEVIVRLSPDRPQERLILGTIDGSGGRRAAAEQSFLACLDTDPDNADLQARLSAIRHRAFEPFAITQGFGSPADRLRTRLKRREKAAAAA